MINEKEQFKQWESNTFGVGYGTGELPIMKAIKVFFDSLSDRSYDFEELEDKLGDTVTWLLINAFYKTDMIEWGSSARFGWLTSCGEYVRDFVKDKSPDELYEILMDDEIDCLCECKGDMEGHEDCGKNPMVNENYADKLKYSQHV